MKNIFTFCVVLVAVAAMPAQTPASTPAGSQDGQSIPPVFQKKAQAFADSRGHFVSHDYAKAETALLAGNQAKAGTPQWHCESGFSLMQMAFAFQAQSDAVTSSAIARLALAHLQQADRAYGTGANASEIATEKELTGFLCENLLGDRNAAKTYYQAAVNLSPSTSGHAAESLAAIVRTEKEETRKRSRAPGN